MVRNINCPPQVLCNIQVFAKAMPSLFAPHYEDFFICCSDSYQVKALKLEILSSIATDSSILSIFNEFQVIFTHFLPFFPSILFCCYHVVIVKLVYFLKFCINKRKKYRGQIRNHILKTTKKLQKRSPFCLHITI